MTAPRFKKGDRVVSIVTAEGWPPIGALGTVDENNSPMPCVTWDEPHKTRYGRSYGRGGRWMHEYDLGRVSTKIALSVPPDEAKTSATSAPRRRIIELW
jgi:hypothetical protein